MNNSRHGRRVFLIVIICFFGPKSHVRCLGLDLGALASWTGDGSCECGGITGGWR